MNPRDASASKKVSLESSFSKQLMKQCLGIPFITQSTEWILHKSTRQTSLLHPREELRDEIFGLLLNIVLWEPLGHDVGDLLPVVYNLLQVLLALNK